MLTAAIGVRTSAIVSILEQELGKLWKQNTKTDPDPDQLQKTAKNLATQLHTNKDKHLNKERVRANRLKKHSSTNGSQAIKPTTEESKDRCSTTNAPQSTTEQTKDIHSNKEEPQVLCADWDFEKRKAKMCYKGETIYSEVLYPLDPQKGGASQVGCDFKLGREVLMAKLQVVWWDLVTKKLHHRVYQFFGL